MVRIVHRNHKAREDTASEVRNSVRKVNTDCAERPQKPQGLLGTGRTAREKGIWRWGRSEIIYLSLHCHHQKGFCIKTGSDKSHFNVSLTVRDKVTRQYPQTTTFLEEKGEPKRNRTEALLFTVLTARPNRPLNEIVGSERVNDMTFKWATLSCCYVG